MITCQDLQDFQKEIADLDHRGLIKAPIHIRTSENCSYENSIIYAYRNIRPQDYSFSYWDSSCLALLKGVPKHIIIQRILDGHSIALNFPQYRFFASGIAGSLMGTAVGTAWAIKKLGLDEIVYNYCGDMSSEMGIFHESIKYAYNHQLPIKFIVGDNGVSVTTKTREIWGKEEPWFEYSKYGNMITYFKYTNIWSHSGRQGKVTF